MQFFCMSGIDSILIDFSSRLFAGVSPSGEESRSDPVHWIGIGVPAPLVTALVAVSVGSVYLRFVIHRCKRRNHRIAYGSLEKGLPGRFTFE
jgi:hypothetical protein